MPTLPDTALCSTCSAEIPVAGPAAHRCRSCGEIVWPLTAGAPRRPVGLAMALLSAAPIWLALAGAIAMNPNYCCICHCLLSPEEIGYYTTMEISLNTALCYSCQDDYEAETREKEGIA
jgi:hypothetical protein